MQIQKLLSLFVFLVSVTAWADVVKTPLFSDLGKCRQHFFAKNGGGKNFDVNKADEFCFKNMSPMDFCVGRALLKTMAENSLSSEQVQAFKNKYTNECAASAKGSSAAAAAGQQMSIAHQQAEAAQLAALQAAADKKKAEEEAKKNQGKKEGGDKGGDKGGGPGLGDIAKAAQGIFGKEIDELKDKAKDGAKAIFGDKDKKPTDDPKPSGSSGTASSQGEESAADREDAEIGAAMRRNQEDADRRAKMVQDEKDFRAKHGADEPAKEDGGLSDKEKEFAAAQDREDAEMGAAMREQQAQAELDRAKKEEAAMPAQEAETDAAADEMAGISDDAKGAADNLKANDSGDKAQVKGSENITAAAKRTSEELNQKVQQASSTAQSELQQGTYSLPFSKTAQDVQKAQTEIKAYTEAAKEQCTQSAEKADTLCQEEKSPGRQAVNAFMQVMGPILGSMDNAQKALASTSKTANTAKAGLTVAKTACSAAQATCNGLCQKAIAELQKKKQEAEQKIQQSAQSDEQQSESTMCKSYDQSAQMCASSCPYGCCPQVGEYQQAAAQCRQENQKKKQAADKAKQEIAQATQKELTPENGTSPGLAKTCQKLDSQIEQLAKQIGDLLKKKKEADEADKKLNTSGVAGGTPITPQKYCEAKETSNTQFCKCQKDNTQEGCHGFVAKTDELGTQRDAAGLNIKGGNGLSNFAGIAPKKNGDTTSTTTSPGAKDGDAEKSALAGGTRSSSDAGAARSLSAAGGASSGGGSNGRAGSRADSAGGEGPKKWSFGSFINALTGGSGSKGAAGKANANGNASGSAKDAKQDAAIKRKIASDKLSAEVSAASGKSNWEKIRQAYLIKENTLLSEK